MQQRRLGKQGLKVSPVGLGTMGMAGVAGMDEMYGPVDQREAIATIHRALDLGVTFLIPPKCTARTRMRNWLARRSAATRSNR